MVLVRDQDIPRLRESGVIVICAQCQNAGATKNGATRCQVLQLQMGAEQLRICSQFEERH